MNIICITLWLFLVSGSVLPSKTMPLPLPLRQQHNLTKQNHILNLTHPNHLRPVPLLLPSPHRHILTSQQPTIASSVKTSTAPTPSEKKVEKFAQKLRDEMEAQERVLNTYITTLKRKHASVEMNLKRVRGILSGLRNEIMNATKFVNEYQGEEQEQTDTMNIVNSEYLKSRKMYEDEKQNLQFEKEFLDAIIQYINLRKKC